MEMKPGKETQKRITSELSRTLQELKRQHSAIHPGIF